MAEMGVFFFGKYLEIGRDVCWRDAQIEIHFQNFRATIRMNDDFQNRRDFGFTTESISMDDIGIRINFGRHEFAVEPSQTSLLAMHWTKLGWKIHDRVQDGQETGEAGGSQGRPFPPFPGFSPFQPFPAFHQGPGPVFLPGPSFPAHPHAPSYLVIQRGNTDARAAAEEQLANGASGPNQKTLEATKRKNAASSSRSRLKKARLESEKQ